MYGYICIRKTIMLVAGILFLFGTGCSDNANLKQSSGITPGDYTFQISVDSLEDWGQVTTHYYIPMKILEIIAADSFR